MRLTTTNVIAASKLQRCALIHVLDVVRDVSLMKVSLIETQVYIHGRLQKQQAEDRRSIPAVYRILLAMPQRLVALYADPFLRLHSTQNPASLSNRP